MMNPNMKIKVYKDGELVYKGPAWGMIQENQGDDDIMDLLDCAEHFGRSAQYFDSGLWEIAKA